MKQEEKTLTYVVFDERKDSTLFKIGKSKDVKKRMSSLCVGNPYIGIPYVFNEDAEKYFHLCFNDFVLHNNNKNKTEWFDFKLSKEQTVYVIRNAFEHIVRLYPNYYVYELLDSIIHLTAKEYTQTLNKQINEYTRNT